MGYEPETFKEELEVALASYQTDGGRSLLREAFPDADHPDADETDEASSDG